MFSSGGYLLATIGGLASIAQVHAQFPPKPEGVTVLESKLVEGARISYKEVRQYELRSANQGIYYFARTPCAKQHRV